MKEVIKLEIESVREKIKFYRNIFLALLIGVVSSFYNIIKDNINNNSLYVMIYFGLVAVVLLLVKLKTLENDEKSLINEYERLENDNI